MGREGHVTRNLLGRSAFDEPLTENGMPMLGHQTIGSDTSHFLQEWNARGRPVNSRSEELNRAFCCAQNEVLAAYRVIARKGETIQYQHRQSRHDQQSAVEAEVDSLAEENNTGFVLKLIDRCLGKSVSWGIRSHRARVLGSGVQSSPLASGIMQDLRLRPVQFCLPGLLASQISDVVRIYRTDGVSEPVNAMNYLGYNTPQHDLNAISQIPWHWDESLLYVVEVVLDILASLQSLGFTLPVPLKEITSNPWKIDYSNLMWTIISPSREFVSVLLTYTAHRWLKSELTWRIYGLIRQISCRPDRPTPNSIRAAENDDFTDEGEIIGMGRRLSADLTQRFFGPRSFLPALAIAFPFMNLHPFNEHYRQELKAATLERCRAADARSLVSAESRSSRRRILAAEILTNLVSLGVDVEEDFYVDVDHWTRELSLTRPTQLQLGSTNAVVESEVGNMQLSVHHRIAVNTPSPNLDADVFLAEQVLQARDVPPIADAAMAAADISDTNYEAPLPEPVPGISRAARLGSDPIQPLQRRPTVTDASPDELIEFTMVARSSRRQRVLIEKRRRKGMYKITRLTTYPVDSFAWHASSILADVILLPLDQKYIRCLSIWALSRFSQSSARKAWFTVPETRHGAPAMSGVMLLLMSFGVECSIRGLLWCSSTYLALSWSR